MGGVGLKLAPVLARQLLGLPGLSGPLIGASWVHSYSNRRCTNIV